MRLLSQYSPIIVKRAIALAAAATAMLFSSCTGGTSRSTPIQIFNDMRQQLKYKAQRPSSFAGFADGRADRRPVPGTIARGSFTGSDDPFYTGVSNGEYIAQNPLKISAELLTVGQAKFNTYCQPCHGRLGNGKGIVNLHAPTWQASNMLDDRVRAFVDGDYFDVITHGRRSMPAYGFQISEHDRWAIVSYIRVLQRASHATVDDVPQDLRAELH
jgi:mono/diheme cytochrome c family protein